MKCPHCKAAVPDKFSFCPQCGAAVRTESGKVIRPDGTRKTIRRKPYNASELTSQAIAGFQRAWLLQDEYNIWDFQKMYF